MPPRLSLPPRSQVEVEQWQADATDRINDHTSEIDRVSEVVEGRRIQLDPSEVALVAAISRACPLGMKKSYDMAELGELLPDLKKDEIEAAAHHLIRLGLFDDESAIGHLIIRPTQLFYEATDHQVRGWNTQDDALTLAKLMLEKKEGHSSALLALTGWEPRRFNPAQRRLLDHLPSGLVSKEIQPNFATSYVAMAPQVVAALRTFIELN